VEPALIPRGTSASHVTKCHYPLERWPMTEDEMRVHGAAVAAPAAASAPAETGA
jgi:hypothetical protein